MRIVKRKYLGVLAACGLLYGTFLSGVGSASVLTASDGTTSSTQSGVVAQATSEALHVPAASASLSAWQEWAAAQSIALRSIPVASLLHNGCTVTSVQYVPVPSSAIWPTPAGVSATGLVINSNCSTGSASTSDQEGPSVASTPDL
jgi:hypothetical protein